MRLSSLLLLCVFCWSVLSAAVASIAAEQRSPYHRWAVVASKELQDGGLPDLLTAELSRQDGVELVERDQLELATRELELSACFGSQAVGKRLQLGQLLKADALLLLSLEEHEKQKSLKLVISDCVYGARLRFEYVPYAPQQLEAATRQCAALVQDTRQRFAGGIQKLIGVTHFLSKNLTHDFDHLQTGYASLLAHALSTFPGVAVLEIEEARTLANELRLTGGQLADRVVPLFVEGEFTMSAAQAESPLAPAARNATDAPTVSLAVRVTDGTRIRQRPARTGLTPTAVTEWLTGALPREIVQVSQGSGITPVSREQQRRVLIARAEAFSQVGAYEQATALREATLLLEPEDLAQQLTLILEYCRWQTTQSRQDAKLATEVNRKVLAGGRVEEEPIWEQTYAARLARFQLAARHTEDVIRRRQVNPLEAGTLISQVSNTLLISSLYKEIKQAPLTKAAYDEFCWRVLPLFPTLDGGLRQGTEHPVLRRGQAATQPMAVEAQHLHCAQAGLTCITMVSPALIGIGRDHTAWDSSRTLDDLYRWATQVAPTTSIVPEFVEILTGDAPPDLLGGIADNRLRAEDVRRFCLRLQQTKQPLNVFYGRCGSLALRVYCDRDSPLDAAVLQEADTLLKSLYATRPELARIPARIPAGVRVPGRSLTKLRAEIANHLAKQGMTVAAEAETGGHPGKRPDVPKDAKRHPLPKNPIPLSALCSRLAFTPIAGLTAEWHGWLKCTETLDVMWSFDSVYVMTQPGRVERILEIAGAKERVFAKDLIYGVVWDGQNLWITCMTSGIHVLSPAGQVLGHVQAEQGLPAYEPVEWPREVRGLGLCLFSTPLQLYPIEPGKCLVLGKYGQHKRVWLATVARAPGEATFGVTVVQTFTKVPDSQAPRRDADDDLAEIFEPGGLLEYAPANADGPRRLLIGRRWGDLQKGRRPLAVDLGSLAVSIFPVRLPPSFNEPFWWQWLAVDGRVFVSGSRGIDLFSPPPEETAAAWTSQSVVKYPVGTPQATPAALVAQRDAIYGAGAHWFRIDRQQLNSEQLTQLPLPNSLCFEHYAASAQYGLVAWNRGDPLYRVAIDGPALDDQDLATQYPFVPPTQRERHQRAVQTIRALGGSVDTWRSACRHRVRPEYFSHWRTIVYLPQAWKGQAAALVHLKDLYNLRELVLVQADIGDEGLVHVGQLTDLEALELVETKITDAGLMHLGGLRNLVYCRLEGSAGGDQFSDAGLRHLQVLPGLERLTVYGRGFTDAGLKLFQNPRCRLREVRSLETAITKQGISEVTKLKPWFRCVDNETPPEFDGTGSTEMSAGTR